MVLGVYGHMVGEWPRDPMSSLLSRETGLTRVPECTFLSVRLPPTGTERDRM